MKPSSKVIGIAVGQKSLLLAEVAPRAGRPAVQHLAEFVFPEGLSLSTPDKLGQALGQFLKSHKFSTRDAVIGLPAKRLLTRRKEVPPAPTEVAASALRMAAEGEFSAELDNLVMDFAGTPSKIEATTVLLMATNREILDQCLLMAKTAGLRISAITSTTAALGRATSRLPGGDGWVLNLGEGGAEVVVQHGQDPAHIRHLNVNNSDSPESLGALAGEIRRMMASIPRNGTPMTLAMWKGPPSNGQQLPGNLLEQRLSVPVTTPELATLVSTDGLDAEGYASAVAIGLSVLDPSGLPVDFLHSRLAPPAEPRITKAKKIAIACVLLVLIIVGSAYYYLFSKQLVLAQINEQITSKANALADTNMESKRLADALAKMPQGPHFVTVLRDVSLLFPPEGNTIWATRLSNLHDPQTWELEGKAVNNNLAQALVAAMNARSDRFENARLIKQVQEPNQQFSVFSYTIQFTYRGD